VSFAADWAVRAVEAPEPCLCNNMIKFDLLDDTLRVVYMYVSFPVTYTKCQQASANRWKREKDVGCGRAHEQMLPLEASTS